MDLPQHTSTLQRRTAFEYDQARRLNRVEFDTDGDSVVEQTVSYSYDRGGQRTTLTIDEGGTPLTISYQYDAKGQLIGLSDWDSQATTFEYDNAGRHTATRRASNLDSSYRYDRASRMKELRHATANTTFARFRYTVDGRGNRVRAVEAVRTGDGQVVTQSSDPNVVYLGNWTDDTTSDPKAILRVPFASDQIEVRMGTGPNHSMFDIYLDGVFWSTVDGYETVAGDRDIAIALNYPGPHELEIRNRSLHSYLARTTAGFNSNNYTLQFISLTESGEYDVHDIQYTYDALSRLQQADYDNGGTVYDYDYDVMGNLLNNNGVSRSYNAVNQLIHDGTNSLSYDRNGNLTSDGVNSYAWDQANRMLSVGNTSYKYDGANNRIQQTVNSIVTDYLNDVQPGLTKLLRQDDGTNVKHFIHAPRGIHAVDDGTSWNYYLQDGLGSVRNDGLSYSPIGVPSAVVDDFGFTGEYTNGELLFLRARYMNPNMGTFLSLDPFEGVMDRPMSLNDYMYVEGNLPNYTDPTGNQPPPSELEIIFREAERLAMVIASQRDYIITEEIARLALTQALQNHGYPVTTAALESGMQYFVSSAVVARLGIAGVAVYALLPQQYGPYIVNTYDYVFGTYSQYWANPANWPSSQPQLWVDLGNACAASPSSQLLPMPIGPQITTQSQTQTNTTQNPYQVNMDTTALTGLVAYNPNNLMETQSIKVEIDSLISGRQMVATSTALTEFNDGLLRLAGPTEQLNALMLMVTVMSIPDNPSPRIMAVPTTASFDANDRAIFGTGDQLRIPTITGNTRALAYLRSQGVAFNAIPHSPARFREKFV